MLIGQDLTKDSGQTSNGSRQKFADRFISSNSAKPEITKPENCHTKIAAEEQTHHKGPRRRLQVVSRMGFPSVDR